MNEMSNNPVNTGRSGQNTPQGPSGNSRLGSNVIEEQRIQYFIDLVANKIWWIIGLIVVIGGAYTASYFNTQQNQKEATALTAQYEELKSSLQNLTEEPVTATSPKTFIVQRASDHDEQIVQAQAALDSFIEENIAKPMVQLFALELSGGAFAREDIDKTLYYLELAGSNDNLLGITADLRRARIYLAKGQYDQAKLLLQPQHQERMPVQAFDLLGDIEAATNDGGENRAYELWEQALEHAEEDTPYTTFIKMKVANWQPDAMQGAMPPMDDSAETTGEDVMDELGTTDSVQ